MILEITFDKLFTPVGNTGFGYCSWNGKLAVVTNVNGTTTSYAYDVIDRVTNITWSAADGSRIGGFEYFYDAIGRIISRSHDLGTNIFNRSYAYDSMDRLALDGNVSYAYDAAGNRMTKNGDVEGDVSYTLGVGDRLASWSVGSYAYNDAGCVTRIERVGKPTLDLIWNGQYQLVSVATNGVFAEGYAYDALGRRVATTTQEGTVRHVYDNNWQCIADVDVTGNVLRSYVWGDGIDNLLTVRIGDETYTALTDIQGTVWGFTDANGEVVARWTYDAWGNVLSSNVSVPALATLRYRFQGREWSAVTGLMNFRMRWYEAVTGRWLSKDPIGLDGGINQYEFCQNAPLIFLDAYGLMKNNEPWQIGVTTRRHAPSGNDYEGDPFGHNKKPGTNEPIDPHIHQYPPRGPKRTFNLDLTPRDGGPKIPKRDLPVVYRVLNDVKRAIDGYRMPVMIMIIPPEPMSGPNDSLLL